MSFLSRWSKIIAVLLFVYVVVWLLSNARLKVVSDLFFTPLGMLVVISVIIGEAYWNNL